MLRALLVATVAFGATASGAVTTSHVVDARLNSSSGGTPKATVALTAGQALTISVAPTDLWSAGALPRWSNANGLTGNQFATGTDESGEAAGTLIGTSFGLWPQNGFSAPYGALVGRIGSAYQLIGTSFNGAAWGTGTLDLFYWDSNNDDNFQSITASISAAVPEPASWAMLIAGFGLVGAAARRRTAVAAR